MVLMRNNKMIPQLSTNTPSYLSMIGVLIVSILQAASKQWQVGIAFTAIFVVSVL